MVGSVEWQRLDDDDPKKIAAVFDAAQHHALRVEMAQEAMAEASQAISVVTDWAEVADAIRRRQEFVADHPWAARKPA